MNKKKTIIVAIVIVLAIVAYFYWKKRTGTNIPGTETKSLDQNFNIQVADTRNDNFPLNENSKGPRVESVQRAANRLIEKMNAIQSSFPSLVAEKPYPVLVPDSIWGPKTTAAVLKVAGVGYYSGTGMTETQFNTFIELSNK